MSVEGIALSQKPVDCNRFGMLLIGCVMLSSLTGCWLALGAAAGAAGATYYMGELRATRAATPEKAQQATTDALKELGIPVSNIKKGDGETKVIGQGADGKEVTIRIKPEGPDVVKIGVRVGDFGDQARAGQIMGEIEERL